MYPYEIPTELPILTLKNAVMFPGVVLPITVGRAKSKEAVEYAIKHANNTIGVLTQKNVAIARPTTEDLFAYGTIAKIEKVARTSDGRLNIAIKGHYKFCTKDYIQEEPFFLANIEKKIESPPAENEKEHLLLTLRKLAIQVAESSPAIPNEAKPILERIKAFRMLLFFISSNLQASIPLKQQLLEEDSQKYKYEILVDILRKELQVAELNDEIQSKVQTDLDQQQREYILRQQIKAIQAELGEDSGDSDIENLKKRAEEKLWTEEAQKVFNKEIKRMSRLNPAMPEYGVLMNYLDWMLELPWHNYTEDNFAFKEVQGILDEDHYGLEEVKDRILEYLAVLKLKSDKKAPILCFHGPPGVGKTSLGKSIARAMGKEFIRISLGGMKDEAEIRGHRRTYIGAMPGRIIQGLKRANTSNPIFMLDEIDKIGSNFRGDPASALLEVLDPEQNDSFRDHFLEVEYDLSSVMFIATANTLSTIHPALRDRMEVINLTGYSQEEKREIAKRHLIPTALHNHGLLSSHLSFSDEAIKRITEAYTREAGVRNLSQKIAAICRGVAKEVVLDENFSIHMEPLTLKQFLGVPRFENEQYHRTDAPGVSIGLAWTPVGGDILFIESTLTKGSGKLSMTGRLGNVMKESATLAYTYIRSNCEQLGIPFDVFKNWDIHIHIPAGAVPKDGPSAGITLLTAMTSLLTQKLVKERVAMTGEITLRGRVLPVGGIKSKVLAAVRAGIQTIIMCKDNEKDVLEIKEEYLHGIKFIYVDHMHEVLTHALEAEVIANSRNLLPAKPQKTT